MNLWIPGLFLLGFVVDGIVRLISKSLRKKYREIFMIYVTVGVAGFLFVYLWVALIRPEWFLIKKEL